MKIRMLLVIALACFTFGVQAQDDTGAKKQTLFTNVMVFNGTDNKLLDVDVLVEGNMIKQVGESLSASGATVIDGGGRTLMPGLADTHTHIMFSSLAPWRVADW